MHPWGDFVDDQTLRCDERFNAKDADVIQFVQDFSRGEDCVYVLGFGETCGQGCGVQNTVAVDVFAWVKAHDFT